MKELPLKSEEELRGDKFAQKVEGPKLTEILQRQGQKIADMVNRIKSREHDRKSCHCRACSDLRRREVEPLVDDLNWTVHMIAHPTQRGKEEVQVFQRENGRGWDLKLVKRSGGANIFKPK